MNEKILGLTCDKLKDKFLTQKSKHNYNTENYILDNQIEEVDKFRLSCMVNCITALSPKPADDDNSQSRLEIIVQEFEPISGFEKLRVQSGIIYVKSI